ncbi:MAG: hypothetical protein JWR38_2713 [Mucilaginibacter sp.]|nr:hypothetical protein [Mucilaginibacter sp.]
MKRPIYSISNVIYQIIVLWCLVMANAYFNDLIVLHSIMWKNNNQVIKTLEMLVEAALLILSIYAINQEALSGTEDKSNRNTIANRTAKIHIIVTLIFIIALKVR